MGKFIHQLVAGILLLSMGLIFMPKQVFSHHDHHLEICNESKIHLEEKEHDCSLCKFRVPHSLIKNAALTEEAISHDLKLHLTTVEHLSINCRSVHHLRGPPRS